MQKLKKIVLIFHFFITFFSYSIFAQFEIPITSFPEGFLRGRGDFFDLNENVGTFYSIAVTKNQTLRFYHRFDELFISYIYDFSFLENGLFNISIQEITMDLTNNISTFEGSGFCNQKECFLSANMGGYYLEEIIRINSNDGLVSKYSKRTYEGNIVYLEEYYNKTDVTAVCGDGLINGIDEECDDGNVINGDGCDSSCHIEAPSLPNIACTGYNYNTSVPAYFDYTFGHVSNPGLYDILATAYLGFFYFTGNLGGFFSPAQNVSLTSDSYGVAFADIDDDGDVDILTSGPNGNLLSANAVSLNTLGIFGPAVTLYTSNGLAFYGSRVVGGDFNRDNKDDGIWFSYDTAYIAYGPYGLIPTLSSDPPMGFSTIYPYPLSHPGTVTSANTFDINDDGYLDAIATMGGSAGYDGEIAFFINTSEGLALTELHSSNTSYFSEVNLNPYGFAAADFNNDGKTDIAFSNYSLVGSTVVVGLRTNADSDPLSYDFSIVYTGDSLSGVAAGDFNNDGFDDLVITPNSDGRLLEGLGNGSFNQNACSLGNVYNPKALDVDGDGYLDLTYANGNVYVLYARSSDPGNK